MVIIVTHETANMSVFVCVYGGLEKSVWLVSSVFILGLLPNSGLGKRSPLAYFVTACLSAADTMTQVLQTDYAYCKLAIHNISP